MTPELRQLLPELRYEILMASRGQRVFDLVARIDAALNETVAQQEKLRSGDYGLTGSSANAVAPTERRVGLIERRYHDQVWIFKTRRILLERRKYAEVVYPTPLADELKRKLFDPNEYFHSSHYYLEFARAIEQRVAKLEAGE